MSHDVVIVGAGCAGLYVAQLLGKENLKVCLVDSKEDLLDLPFRTLGSFIDLNFFGLTNNVVASKISECVFYSKNLHRAKSVNGYILDKVALHKELISTAREQGVAIMPSVKICGVELGLDGRIEYIKDERGNEYRAKVFIDASGISAVLGKKMRLRPENLKIARGLEYNVKYFGRQDQVHLFLGKSFENGYGWIFPLGGSRAIVGFGAFYDARRSNLKERFRKALSTKSLKTLVRLDNDKLSGGTIPATGVSKDFVIKNLLCIGDSIAQVNPMVGEGYRFIMESASIAAPFIVKAIRRNDLSMLEGYGKEWHERFGKIYLESQRLQRIAKVASKSDFLSNVAVWLLGRLDNVKARKYLSADF